MVIKSEKASRGVGLAVPGGNGGAERAGRVIPRRRPWAREDVAALERRLAELEHRLAQVLGDADG